ncbi:MAG: motility associated factor glycosyltransferase family protein [Magnetovibrionaceae bacterium]
MTRAAERAAAGLVTLRQAMPEVAEALVGFPPNRPALEGRWSEDRLVNIKVGPSDWLYEHSAAATTEAQVSELKSNPDLICFPDPADEPPAAFLSTFAAEVPSSGSERPCSGGYGFLFGVGLGDHLEPLIEATECRQLVLIEPNPVLLHASLFAVDWTAIFRRAGECGIGLRFILGSDPEALVRQIEELLIRDGLPAVLDGSFAHLHYPAWALVEARKLFNQRIRNFLIRPNTHEDEAIMLRHSAANLDLASERDVRLLCPGPVIEEAPPVLIVGSGPSLDRDLENLRRLKDHLVIVSCGTALGVLLKNGIRPHLHIENENTAPLVQNLRNFRANYGFDGIRLCCSTTVSSAVLPLFDQAWMYFRAALSPAEAFGFGDQAIPFAGPLVANAALAALSALGFRRFILAGVDCGRREHLDHHAADSVYLDEAYDNYEDGVDEAFIKGEFVREVPGNFGGSVLTSSFYDLSRRTLAETILHNGLDVLNLADGARIDGARPKVSSALDLPPCPILPAEVLDRLWRGAVRSDAGVQARKARLRSARAELASWRETYRQRVAETDPGLDPWDLARSLKSLRGPDAGMPTRLEKTLSGSLSWLERIGLYRAIRTPASDREAFNERFLAALIPAVDQVIADVEEILNRQA